MTINAIGSSASAAALTQTSAHRHDETGPFEAVSDVLGMSADDIRSAVGSGKSLVDLADEKGVSTDDLLDALEDGAPQELQGAADLREIVTQIANQKGPGGPGAGAPGHGGPPPGPPSGVLSGVLSGTQSTTLDALSSLLDLEPDEVTDALQNGGSLSDLLSASGVDLTDLASALEQSRAESTTGFQIDVQA